MKKILNKTTFYFLSTIILAIFVWIIWNSYFSPQSRYSIESIENNKKYTEWRKTIDEDIYGGKTPEETIKFLVDALEKKDVSLASKYFTKENEDLYRNKLEEKINSDELEKILEILKKIERSGRDTGSKDIIEFIYRGDNQSISYSILLKFNNSMAVWKIEEM